MPIILGHSISVIAEETIAKCMIDLLTQICHRVTCHGMKMLDVKWKFICSFPGNEAIGEQRSLIIDSRVNISIWNPIKWLISIFRRGSQSIGYEWEISYSPIQTGLLEIFQWKKYLSRSGLLKSYLMPVVKPAVSDNYWITLLEWNTLFDLFF